MTAIISPLAHLQQILTPIYAALLPHHARVSYLQLDGALHVVVSMPGNELMKRYMRDCVVAPDRHNYLTTSAAAHVRAVKQLVFEDGLRASGGFN